MALGLSHERNLRLPLMSERKIVLPDTSLVIPMTFRSSEWPRFLKVLSFFFILSPIIFLISIDLRSSSVPLSGGDRGTRLSNSMARRLGRGASTSVPDVGSDNFWFFWGRYNQDNSRFFPSLQRGAQGGSRFFPSLQHAASFSFW